MNPNEPDMKNANGTIVTLTDSLSKPHAQADIAAVMEQLHKLAQISNEQVLVLVDCADRCAKANAVLAENRKEYAALQNKLDMFLAPLQSPPAPPKTARLR